VLKPSTCRVGKSLTYDLIWPDHFMEMEKEVGTPQPSSADPSFIWISQPWAYLLPQSSGCLLVSALPTPGWPSSIHLLLLWAWCSGSQWYFAGLCQLGSICLTLVKDLELQGMGPCWEKSTTGPQSSGAFCFSSSTTSHPKGLLAILLLAHLRPPPPTALTS
jgi:hypothetical protein